MPSSDQEGSTPGFIIKTASNAYPACACSYQNMPTDTKVSSKASGKQSVIVSVNAANANDLATVSPHKEAGVESWAMVGGLSGGFQRKR